MLNQLMSQMQSKTEEAKKKLDSVIIETQAENGMVKVKATANKKILSIEISDQIANDKETIEDLIIVAVNKAIQKADEIHEKEMGGIAKNILPDLNGLFA